MPRLGASLAYYTLFAIAPILIVATAVAGMAFGATAVRGEIIDQLDQLIGPDGAFAVQSLLEGATRRRPGVVAAMLGGITFVIAATGAFLELQAALNTIWRVTAKPGIRFRAFLIDRLRSFGLVIAIGFLLMVSLAMTAALAAVGAWLARDAPSVPLVWTSVNLLVSLIVATTLFALLYRSLPDVTLRWRDVTTGAFVTAVLFTIGQQLIGVYVGRSSLSSSYGAAGSVMVLLLWVYYSCQVVLLGAEFTRIYAAHQGVDPQPESFAARDVSANHRLSASPQSAGSAGRYTGVRTDPAAGAAALRVATNVVTGPAGRAANRRRHPAGSAGDRAGDWGAPARTRTRRG